mmetsp:Transcript_4008/g.6009  ORF Transcript_4008/g.6009 Transcript_4008/m.6009 type:complete len:401 (-) Transcript_4008:136-1338(-)
MQLQVERRAYAPGERINLSGSTVQNQTSSNLDITFRLDQSIMMQTVGQHHKVARRRRRSHNTMGGGGPIQCPPGEGVSPPVVRVPAVPPAFYGAKGSTWCAREAVMWSYALVMKAEMVANKRNKNNSSGSCCEVVVPILVCSAPPYKSSMEKASASVMAPTMVLDPFMLSYYTVNDSGISGTCPCISGRENGGLVVPDAFFTNGPVYVNNYNDDHDGIEENTRGRQQQYKFQPMVLTFPPKEQHEDGESSFVPEPHTVTEEELTGQSETPVADLLRTMHNYHDKRAAVGIWMKEHNASNMQPSDVADILDLVPHCFEQVAVAREIATGINANTPLRPKLTCAHVAMAMKACPYVMADVATAMISKVCDPQNNRPILDALKSFEKIAVERSMPPMPRRAMV